MTIDIARFDPLGRSGTGDLWDQLAQLRECPVGKTELYGGIWLLTRYRDVVEAARDWKRFSSAQGAGEVPLAKVDDIRLMPIETDPPLQRDLRRIIDRHFGPRSMPAAQADVRAAAIELIERFPSGECEFISEFAVPYPALNFFNYAFGVGLDEAMKVMRWIAEMFEAPNTAESAIRSFHDWAGSLIEQRKAAPQRDDVLDSILRAKIDGRAVTQRECMMIIMNMVIGGIETTKHVLGNIAYYLATRPVLRERLDRDRALIPAAVEEFLRYETPAPGLGRTVTCPIEIDGVSIPADDRVILYYGSANRDAAAYDRPDEIVLDRYTRRAAPHLTFGVGVHRCPGAHFARLELRVAIEEMLDRMPHIELAVQDLEYGAGMSRGLVSLPLRFGTTGTNAAG
jgi:cytochrome P450